MSDENAWALIWISWAAGFAVAEGVALKSDKSEATLSHQTRRLFSARHPSQLRRRVGQFTFACAVCWWTHHIWKEA